MNKLNQLSKTKKVVVIVFSLVMAWAFITICSRPAVPVENQTTLKPVKTYITMSGMEDGVLWVPEINLWSGCAENRLLAGYTVVGVTFHGDEVEVLETFVDGGTNFYKVMANKRNIGWVSENFVKR